MVLRSSPFSTNDFCRTPEGCHMLRKELMIPKMDKKTSHRLLDGEPWTRQIDAEEPASLRAKLLTTVETKLRLLRHLSP